MRVRAPRRYQRKVPHSSRPQQASPLTHPDDLAFYFHRQWGHTANEDLLEALGRYYDLPSISLRNVLWHHAKANRSFHGLRLHELYYDRIHPSDHGHSILAHGLAHLFKRADLLREIARSPAQLASSSSCQMADDDARRVGTRDAPDVPAIPMLPNVAGAESRRLECHDPNSLRALAAPPGPGGCDGWSYVVERSPSAVPKPGWLATNPSASCTFTYSFTQPPINATSLSTSSVSSASSTSNVRVVDASGGAWGGVALHRVGIGYLKSYEHMGTIAVTCVHDCTCETTRIDAHTSERISPLDLQYFTARVRPSSSGEGGGGGGRCGIKLTVLNESSSGEYKFKLTALFLNRHGEGAYFGRWIFAQAQEARGAVSVAEQAEERARARKLGAPSRAARAQRRNAHGRRGAG